MFLAKMFKPHGSYSIITNTCIIHEYMMYDVLRQTDKLKKYYSLTITLQLQYHTNASQNELQIYYLQPCHRLWLLFFYNIIYINYKIEIHNI